MRVPPIADGAVEFFLQPGEYLFGDRNTRIRTILGSCVAVTLWHPSWRIGGMCHFMLPTRGQPRQGERDGKYGDEAIDLLLGEIGRVGTRPGEYTLKLFGGGRMFQESAGPDVAQRNVQLARELAQQRGFRVEAEHLGGQGHRSIIFDIWSGDVWVKHTGLGMTPSRPAGAGSDRRRT